MLYDSEFFSVTGQYDDVVKRLIHVQLVDNYELIFWAADSDFVEFPDEIAQVLFSSQGAEPVENLGDVETFLDALF